MAMKTQAQAPTPTSEYERDLFSMREMLLKQHSILNEMRAAMDNVWFTGERKTISDAGDPIGLLEEISYQIRRNTEIVCEIRAMLDTMGVFKG